MAITAYVPSMDEPAKRPPVRVPNPIIPSVRNVALLGFGTVGRAVAEILCRTSRPDLRLTHVFNRAVERKRVSWTGDGVQWTEDFDQVLASSADVVVELIGGVEPAHEFIRQALLSGKSVVTANKHVIAKYGPELLALARQTGQQLEYGASVGGGVPVLAALRYALGGDRIFRACGILNGTCNYILSNMEANGTNWATALAEAQKLGYAESDPSDDVSGLDAACKLAIVVRMAFHAELNAFEVARQSIGNVEPVDFVFAKRLGCTIRQISFAELDTVGLQAAVGPALVPLNSPLANARDNQNAVIFTGEKSGDTLLAGRGAGGDPTAVAVVSDLLAMAHSGNGAGRAADRRLFTSQEPSWRHYVRVHAKQGRNLASVMSGVLSDHGISIDSFLEHDKEKTFETVFLTKTCQGSTLEKAISKLEGVEEPPVLLPVLS